MSFGKLALFDTIWKRKIRILTRFYVIINLQFTDGLKAYPLGSYLTCIGMPDCVDIHKPLCLLERLFYGSES